MHADACRWKGSSDNLFDVERFLHAALVKRGVKVDHVQLSELPDNVFRLTRGGYVIVVNYTPDEQTIAAEQGDLLLGEPAVKDDRMTLKPFDVVIYRCAG